MHECHHSSIFQIIKPHDSKKKEEDMFSLSPRPQATGGGRRNHLSPPKLNVGLFFISVLDPHGNTFIHLFHLTSIHTTTCSSVENQARPQAT